MHSFKITLLTFIYLHVQNPLNFPYLCLYACFDESCYFVILIELYLDLGALCPEITKRKIIPQIARPRRPYYNNA